jgi:transcriptional regulator with XRE-family HTH domain
MLAVMPRRQPIDKPPHPLRQWRDQHDLSQDELAQLTGVGQGMISHIERYFRVPRKSTIIKLQAHTGLPTEALMFPERFLEQNPEYFRPKKGRQPRRERMKHPGGEEGPPC